MSDEHEKQARKNDFGDGTAGIEVPQSRIDAIERANKEDEKRKKTRSKTTSTNNAPESGYPTVKPYQETNTSGTVIYVDEPATTPEKRNWVQRRYDKGKEKLAEIKEDVSAMAKHTLGLNEGNDDLGAAARARDEIDTTVRPGGGEVSFGGGATVSVKTGDGYLDEKAKEELKKKWERKIGEPCDTEEKKEIGIGSSLFDKFSFRRVAEGFGFKKRTKISGEFKISASGDLVCVRPEGVAVTVIGAGAHAVENTETVQKVKDSMKNATKRREAEQGL